MISVDTREKRELIEKWNAGTATAEEVAWMNVIVFGLSPVDAAELADISTGASDGDVIELE